MKIVVFEIEPWERSAFEALEDEHEVRFVEEPLGPDNAGEHADAEVVSVFIDSDLGEQTLARLEALRLVALRSTGADHVDDDVCEARGIAVCNVPTYGTATVAEHAFALILAVGRRLVEASERTRRGDFTRGGLRGVDLHGRTLGIVGAGDIGAHAAKIGVGFGMRVLAYDVQHDEALAEEVGFTYVELDALLERSDVVSIHVPLNEHTRGLVGREQIERMRDGVILVNTARGGVVDVEALVEALASGKIAGAGLDVLPEEPAIHEEAELLRRAFRERHRLGTLLADHVLLRMRNVVITPHIGFDTEEAVRRILETTVDNIRAFADGEAKNLVSAA